LVAVEGTARKGVRLFKYYKMSQFSTFNGNDEDENEVEQKYAHLISG